MAQHAKVVKEAQDGPWERKRVRMSLEIERAGLSLLAGRGLDDVTVEQVAAAAGISVRTFFRYFRNVPDLLTPVPRREVDSICRRVAARPPAEGLLDAFRAVFEAGEDPLPEAEDGPIRAQNLELWTRVARTDPERVSALSHASPVMTAGFTEMIAERLGLDGAGRRTAGVLGAALAGVVWSVYLDYIASDMAGSLPAMLDSAFELLGELYRTRRIGG